MNILSKISLFKLLMLLLFFGSCSGTKEIKSFIPSRGCKNCEEFLSKRQFLKNDSTFKINSDDCTDYFLKRGDRYIPSQEAISFYKNALEIDSSNQEAVFKIAYLYDLFDSTERAKFYYDKVNQNYSNLKMRYKNNELPEIDVEEIKRNFAFNDSLISNFINAGRNSSITFDFVYDYTYADFIDTYISSFFRNIFSKKVYLTVYGSGEFETTGYYETDKTKKISFSGKLPDSVLSQILKIFVDIRFLTLYNPYDFGGKGFNHFDYNSVYYEKARNPPIFSSDHDGPKIFDRISIETPKFNHSISVSNITQEDGPYYNFVYPIREKIPWDVIKYDLIDKKLYKLSELWVKTFNYDLLKYRKD